MIESTDMATTETRNDITDSSRKFSELAGQQQRGVLAELGDFLITTKKWWLIPVLLALAVAAVLEVLGSSAAAPFIYTIF
jgi:hypothetical protein